MRSGTQRTLSRAAGSDTHALQLGAPLAVLAALAATVAYLVASDAGDSSHVAPGVRAADRLSGAKLERAYARLPLAFEANRGQTDPRARFLSRGAGYTLFLTPPRDRAFARADGIHRPWI